MLIVDYLIYVVLYFYTQFLKLGQVENIGTFDLITQYRQWIINEPDHNSIDNLLGILKTKHAYETVFLGDKSFIIHKFGLNTCQKIYYSTDQDISKCGEGYIHNIRDKYVCKIFECFDYKYFNVLACKMVYIKYISMEYLNVDLRKIYLDNQIKTYKIYDLLFLNKCNELKNILYCITKAIHCLQVRNLVHLDIKPENIMRHEYNGKFIYKLIDFEGLQKIFGNRNGTYRYTHGYQPPELLFDNEYHFNSDIWSLGMLAYAIVTGGNTPAYENDKKNDCYEHFIINKPTIINSLKIDKTLRKFILDCLNNVPHLRPTARELLKHDFLVGVSL